MYDNYIELKIEGLTRGRELHGAYILVLREKDGERFYPVLTDVTGYKIIHDAMHFGDFAPSRLMNRLAARVGMTMLGVRLMPPHGGKTQALIDFELLNEIVSITVTAAEGIAAAMETHTGIWAQRALLDRQAAQPHPEQSVSLPITAMDNELLQEALDLAVADDNFELATVLRDELRKRLPDGAVKQQ